MVKKTHIFVDLSRFQFKMAQISFWFFLQMLMKGASRAFNQTVGDFLDKWLTIIFFRGLCYTHGIAECSESHYPDVALFIRAGKKMPAVTSFSLTLHRREWKSRRTNKVSTPMSEKWILSMKGFYESRNKTHEWLFVAFNARWWEGGASFFSW